MEFCSRNNTRLSHILPYSPLVGIPSVGPLFNIQNGAALLHPHSTSRTRDVGKVLKTISFTIPSWIDFASIYSSVTPDFRDHNRSYPTYSKIEYPTASFLALQQSYRHCHIRCIRYLLDTSSCIRYLIGIFSCRRYLIGIFYNRYGIFCPISAVLGNEQEGFYLPINGIWPFLYWIMTYMWRYCR